MEIAYEEGRKAAKQIFAENMANNAFNRLSSVLDLRRKKERYIVEFMKDLNQHLVQNIKWDTEKKEIIGKEKGKITIFDKDNKVLLEFNTFNRREAWMDDDEVKEALWGLFDFVEVENHRPSLDDWLANQSK